MRAPQPSGTNSPSSSSHAYPSGCAIESHERCATARVARGDPAALTGPYRPARERPARARPWRRGSPDPIPNSEVKPAIAESTAATGCGRIGRRARGGCFLCIAGPRTMSARGPAACWGALCHLPGLQSEDTPALLMSSLPLLRSVRRLLAPRPGCLRHRDGASQAGPRAGEDTALERRGLSVMHDARF